MCEYQRIKEVKNPHKVYKPQVPYCQVTGGYCTYCVYGNGDTYNKAKKLEDNKNVLKNL